MTVAIIDYGSGNLHSAAKAFERAARESGRDQPILVTGEPDAVRRADRIVLPGVGAFADCRRGLKEVQGMVEALEETVRRRGRPFLVFKAGFLRDKVGAFDTELVEEWFRAFATNAGMTLHVEALYGSNDHHVAESCFKGLARALRAAVSIDPRAADEVPSTKGRLGS